MVMTAMWKPWPSQEQLEVRAEEHVVAEPLSAVKTVVKEGARVWCDIQLPKSDKQSNRSMRPAWVTQTTVQV